MYQDDFNEIARALRKLSVGSYLFQCQVAAELELHPTDLQAIHELGMAEPLTAGELGARLKLTSGATTAVIDRLVKLGWLERSADPQDRRRAVLRLGAKRASLKSKYRGIDQKVKALIEAQSPAGRSAIRAFLEALVTPTDV